MACGGFRNGVNIFHLAGNAYWITACDGERKHLIRGSVIYDLFDYQLTLDYLYND